MASNEALIVAGVRTALGAMGGGLAAVPATQLGATCVKALVARAGVPGEAVNEVIMGNCIAAGLGMNPARQVGINGGLPPSVGATTLNRACASGMRAVMLGAQAIRAGDSEVVIAGGMENMTRPPYLLLKGREGYRMGHDQVYDALIHDGLTDAFTNKHMGVFADRTAEKYGFTKQQQDDYAVRSHARARKASAEGISADEIVPVEFTVRGKATTFTVDEGPSKFDEAKLRNLKPAFGPEGTVTAGNASSINDGAAALLVASDGACRRLNLKPVARIVAGATFSREPEWFTIAPAGAVKRVLDHAGWSVGDVDLFEVNEAFAAVALAVERELGLDPEKYNIYGGAVALGHPVGCSGARVLVTLLNSLKRTGGRRGVATLCVGGGEGIAMAIETLA
ncbi:MAG TPA: thiolase family protein [Isosphaeraceae bacterium]|jgi:acetyl-CoA C-acetyltransferase